MLLETTIKSVRYDHLSFDISSVNKLTYFKSYTCFVITTFSFSFTYISNID